MREVLRSDLRTYDSMIEVNDSGHCCAAAFAVAGAFARLLAASSAVVADDSGTVDCTETKPHRSLVCQPAE